MNMQGKSLLWEEDAINIYIKPTNAGAKARLMQWARVLTDLMQVQHLQLKQRYVIVQIKIHKNLQVMNSNLSFAGDLNSTEDQ